MITPGTVSRVKSIGASRKADLMCQGCAKPALRLTAVAAPSPPRECPMTPMSVKFIDPTRSAAVIWPAGRGDVPVFVSPFARAVVSVTVWLVWTL